MEYAQAMCKDSLPCDENFIRYVGYSYGTGESGDCIRKYYSADTRRTISNKVTELLEGVHPDGKKIVVPDSDICTLMSAIQSTYRPQTGDIHTRYIIPTGRGSNDYVQDMINQVIEAIVSQAKTFYMTEECNRKLTVWTTVLGDFNSEGLRSHSQLKIREDSTPMLFNMNY
jgi:hypothetical protein